MAQIYNDDSGKDIRFGHFFIHSPNRTLQENLDEFYRYIIDFLLHYFPDASTLADAPVYNSDFLETVLYEISDILRKQNRRLIIVIDALDEATGKFNYEKWNILNLPKALPSGVFVALSIRWRNPGSSFQPPPNSRLINIDPTIEGDEITDQHKRVVRQFVEETYEHSRVPLPYKRSTATKSKSEFIDTVCINTSYNFMILKLVLNDPTYWSGDPEVAIANLNSDLKEYYRGHLARMTGYHRFGLRPRAAYCFALDAEISWPSLLRLLGSYNDPRQAQKILTQWLDQGLLVAEMRDQYRWGRAYHKTFREFLIEKLGEQDRSDFLNPITDNFMASSNPLDTIKIDPISRPELIEEQIRLLLQLIRRTERLSELEELLSNSAFWNLCMKTKSGIGTALECLRWFDVGDRRSKDRWDNVMRNSCQQILALFRQGEIVDANGEPVSEAFLLSITHDFSVGTRSTETSVSLIDHFIGAILGERKI